MRTVKVCLFSVLVGFVVGCVIVAYMFPAIPANINKEVGNQVCGYFNWHNPYDEGRITYLAKELENTQEALKLTKIALKEAEAQTSSVEWTKRKLTSGLEWTKQRASDVWQATPSWQQLKDKLPNVSAWERPDWAKWGVKTGDLR